VGPTSAALEVARLDRLAGPYVASTHADNKDNDKTVTTWRLMYQESTSRIDAVPASHLCVKDGTAFFCEQSIEIEQFRAAGD
jgi:hypothetical protein